MDGDGLFVIHGTLWSCSSWEDTSFEPWPVDQSKPKDLEIYENTSAVIRRLANLKTQEQIDSLLLLADLLKDYDDELALTYAREANLLSIEKNRKVSEAISFYYLALLKGGRELFGEGMEDPIVDAKIGLKTFARAERNDWQIRTNKLIGGLFSYLGNKERRYLDSATFYLGCGLELLEQGQFEENDSLILRAELLNDQLVVALKFDTTGILDLYRECLALHQMTGNTSDLARLQQNLGIYYERKKDIDRAESLYRKGVSLAKESQDNHLLSRAYLRLGSLLMKKYRQDRAESLFLEGLNTLHLSMSFQNENKYIAEEIIGRSFHWRAPRSNENRFYDSAIYHYQASMEYAKEEAAFPYMKNLVTNILKLCNTVERIEYKSCEEFLNSEVNTFINNSYQSIIGGITRNLEDANVRIQKAEREAVEATASQKRRNQWMISAGMLMVVGLVFLVLLQQSQKRRLTAQMESLRAQINPHFISNSLNAIESLVNMGENKAASKYLIHFSRLSRRILNSSRTPFVSLTDELKTLEHFLALEQLRFRDKLKYDIEVDESINADLVEVPAMILQPYLENAIWHGIKPKPGPGNLFIEVKKEGKHLVCMVEDDGIGRKKSRELQAATIMKRKSLGMQITQERLRINNKQKGATVQIIDLYDGEGEACGTRVVIHLVYKQKTG